VTDIAANEVKGDRSGILLLFLNELKMGTVLLSVSPVTLVPSIEHLADRYISRISAHPNLAIVICLSRMIQVTIEGSTFALIVSVLVDSVFIITQMSARVAPGKGLAIR
jgi:hypothetical protein